MKRGCAGSLHSGIMKRSLCTAALLVGAAQAAPIKIVFWHSLDGAAALVSRFADEFNASQGQYQVVPQMVGNYREAEVKLDAALKAGQAPALFQAELTYLPKLVAGGQLTDLTPFAKTFAPNFAKDFYPAVWQDGVYGGKRFALPWNVSTPALFYNARALSRAGVAVPKTYGEFEDAAKKLSGRGKRGFLAVADSWTFEQIVDALGGSVVKDGQPNFTSPEVVAALELLGRLVSGGAASGHTLGEGTAAAFGFIRGLDSMAFASVANWSDISRFSLLIQLGAAPMPCAKVCAVPLGGAQLVVPASTPKAEQTGAVAFWQFLMRPERLKSWVESTSYLPPRRSIQPLLADFYAGNPQRAAVFGQLENAVPRPHVPQYDAWRGLLEEAIARTIKGGVPARVALQEAQTRALGK